MEWVVVTLEFALKTEETLDNDALELENQLAGHLPQQIGTNLTALLE